MDKYSAEWRELEQRIHERIEELKHDLCSTHIDEKKSNIIRGRIEGFREVLNFSE